MSNFSQKALTKCNSEMLSFYFELGKEISYTSFKAEYGSKFYDNLSKELIKNLPNVTGLSPVNIRYMERFYLLYKDKIQIFPQLVEELFSIPWGHHRYIIDKCKNVDEAIVLSVSEDGIKGDNWTMTNDIINKELVNKIESLLKNAREKVVREVNNTLLITYMEIGKAIVEDEKLHIDDIEYENKSLRYLSKVLTNKFGKGFSRWNLNYMISFYKNYSGQTLSSHLGWSHYCELLSISDKDKRSFYEKECSNARWSVRELRRQIESSLYERLLLSNNT